MSFECISKGECPAYMACESAIDALNAFADENLVDSGWKREQELIIDMRKRAISSIARKMDCGNFQDHVDSYDDNPEYIPRFSCPLPFGLVENTAFGSPEEMRRSAIQIVNNNKPKGYITKER